MPFLDSLDIANRALQYVGARRIGSVSEDSKNNVETSFSYDKLRRVELRRNIWRFATRTAVLRAIDTTTMILAPQAYDSEQVYLPGAIVADSNGLLWSSTVPDNLNNAPGTSSAWDRYFGPLTVAPWASGNSYYAGELVYKAETPIGTYKVFMSLTNANTDTPDTAAAYSASVTYYRDAVVSYGGSQWRSLIELNLGITPADGPLDFDQTSVYSTGQQVTGSDHLIYTSVIDDNSGTDPVTDDGTHWTSTGTANAWSRTPEPVVSSPNWRYIAGNINALTIVYPIGAGPLSQTSTRNLFRLPAGFLREAPQDPKAGSSNPLGAPANAAYTDWTYAGDYMLTADAGPIIYRFVADVSAVTAMDDMFCEGLACRIATALCEPITQSRGKLQDVSAAYKQFMTEARTVNAIETGPVEPPLDDYIACRA